MEMSRSRWLQLNWLISETSKLATPALIFFLPFCVQAVDFTDADISEEDGVYRIKAAAVIAAPPDYIRYVLADYAHIYRLSPSIIESEVTPFGDDGEQQVRTRLLTCTAVFCREIERVDTVRMLASGDLEAQIVPALSEFRDGKATWKISPFDEHTYLVYEAYLEPDFFIPPVVGTQLVMQSLRDEFMTTFDRVERIASVNLARDRMAAQQLSSLSFKKLPAPCIQNTSVSLR